MTEKISVSIESIDKTTVTPPKEISGWGDEGTETIVEGRIAEITIERNGNPQFGFRICDDGSIILTDYAGMCFEMSVPKGVKLEAYRKWTQK